MWSLDDFFPYAYTICMAVDQKTFCEACTLIESAIPVHQGTRKVDYLDGDMFCRFWIPSGLIHIRSDTQIDAVLVFSTIDLQPILRATEKGGTHEFALCYTSDSVRRGKDLPR